MPDRRIVVVGTTTDYIDLINRDHPGRAVFMTDPRERARAVEPAPPENGEVLCDLARSRQSVAELCKHLRRWGQEAVGIACFDCESLALAAAVATAVAAPFPSAEAIVASRSKFTSKQLWHRAGLPCPETALVQNESDAVRFLESLNRPAVLKPLTGSGSELIFLCHTPTDCRQAVTMTKSHLADHPNARMYASVGTAMPDPRQTLVMEEYVSGDEYSADFILDDDRIEIIRLARKIPAEGQPMGTIAAYIVPADLPAEIDLAQFRDQLRDAARTLGVARSICMLDFIIRDGRALMLELTPRPGGDCLPFLIRQSCGLDMLGLTLDFAEGRPVTIPEPARWRRLVGVRLFAKVPGVIERIDDTLLRQDARVRESYLKRRPGHRVVLPPDDYDSRLLGHVIFEPSPSADISAEAAAMAAKLIVKMEHSRG
ncbi:MAG: ATP-grasp domain-containing protein [candidate division Zixibacteria bacterium]|nr:ATP-grasp domain-containing protein [candidate division Zixibacteria bacterium]